MRKRFLAIMSVMVMFFALGAWTTEVWARAGGGKAAGSRGSRSASPPAERAVQPTSPGAQPGSQGAVQPSGPQRSGWMGGLMGGITGLLIGGAIGGLLFGGLGGGGLFGGIGIVEILLIGGLIYLGFLYMRRRRQTTPARPYGYQGPPEEGMVSAPAMLGMADTESDLARGLRHIRQMDAAFDPERFTDMASEVFFNVQAGWTARDLAGTRAALSGEMYEQLRKGYEQLRDAGRINRLENIALRSVQITEAWQEEGLDFVTVHILASLLDYTVDESSNQVCAGNRTVPVKFAEYWTFTRPCGPHAWQLTAIQQTEDPAQSS